MDKNNAIIGLHGGPQASAFAGTPWVVMEPQKINGNSTAKSNFSISLCYNDCNSIIKHPLWDASKRLSCRQACDADAKAEADQLAALQNAANAPVTSGISSGLIWGVSLGIVGLAVGTIFLIKWHKKRKA